MGTSMLKMNLKYLIRYTLLACVLVADINAKRLEEIVYEKQEITQLKAIMPIPRLVPKRDHGRESRVKLNPRAIILFGWPN